jgi:branched-chain amino acid transport system permease protein
MLTGYAGQFSIGHAAFMAVGAYGMAVLEQMGVPFILALPLGGLIAAAAGLIVGVPALRLSGMYLAIATLAFAFIVEEIITRWESVTRGASGMAVKQASLFGYAIAAGPKLYYVVLFVVIASFLVALNILRAPLGQAMMAVRESQIAAQSMGIHLARVKLAAFSLSAALTGLAGGLYAHAIQFLSPEQFGIGLSIELIVVIFVGGIGMMHGVVFGSIFIIVLPQLIAIAKDYVPSRIAEQPGLQAAVYALVLLLFILLEPQGLAGIWLKIKHYFSMFPYYRKGSFRRAKTFARSESW